MPQRDGNRQPDTKEAPMATFILRKVDDTFWGQFRERAAREGFALRWVLLELIGYYIRHGLPKEQR
jgi:hypothetical protein